MVVLIEGLEDGEDIARFGIEESHATGFPNCRDSVL